MDWRADASLEILLMEVQTCDIVGGRSPQEWSPRQRPAGTGDQASTSRSWGCSCRGRRKMRGWVNLARARRNWSPVRRQPSP